VRKNYHLLNDIESKNYYVNNIINILADMKLSDVKKFASTFPMLFNNSDANYITIMCWAIER